MIKWWQILHSCAHVCNKHDIYFSKLALKVINIKTFPRQKSGWEMFGFWAKSCVQPPSAPDRCLLRGNIKLQLCHQPPLLKKYQNVTFLQGASWTSSPHKLWGIFNVRLTTHPKLTTMDNNVSQWITIVNNRQHWTTMDNNGQQWTTMGINGQQWTTMDNYGQQWTTMDSNRQQWMPMDNN